MRGILNYNENKVEEGVAQCIDAVGFGCSPEELSVKNKLARFNGLTERNKIAKRTAIHISLSFHPDEKFKKQTLRDIASAYMEKIGFGNQPYVVYRHDDTANTHLHIATVNIQSNGKRIDIHRIGENESNIARKEIEEEFGLMKAEEQNRQETVVLKAADLSAAEYGKRPTKNQISNIVRTVAKHFYYANFKEYSDILKEYNVLVDRGEVGTRMYEAGGLVYQLFDKKKGKKIGVSIKASSIYEKPTLKNLEVNYERNREGRKEYRQRIIQTIDLTLERPHDKFSFIEALKKENIVADFKTNGEGFTYGITYIDKTTGCFFNGSDVGKGYSAKAILERIQTGPKEQNSFNKDFVEDLLSKTDFSKGFKDVMTQWTKSGMLVKAFDQENGFTRYKMGQAGTDHATYFPANKRMTNYLQANGYKEKIANTFIDILLKNLNQNSKTRLSDQGLFSIVYVAEKEIHSILNELFTHTYTSSYTPYPLLKEARKKRRKRL